MITVIAGPPCAGKTTLARESAAEGDVVIDFDAIASAFGPTSPAVRRAAHAARAAAINTVLSGGNDGDAWIIHTEPKPEQLQRYSDAGAKVIVLDPGREVCAQRATEDGRPEGTAAVIDSWYENQQKRKGMRDMNIVTKRLNGVIEDVESSSGPGEFTVRLTTPDLDRDGDELDGKDWELPLPNRIQFNTDHDHKVASTVGSAIPQLEGDDIVCRGTYASTDHAQTTRTLVKEGHVPHVSVAYREKKDARGKVSRELINGSFVVVPSNPKAVVLSSKSLGTDEETGELTDEAKAFIKVIVGETLTVKQDDGKTPVSEQLPAPAAPSSEADPPADQDDREARVKALALAAAQQLTFQTKDYVTERD